jgi:uncharacterized protein
MTGAMLAGFLLGCMSSLHCIGMCGPLALSLPMVNDSIAAKFTSTLLYNTGRIVTYSFLGVLFGVIGLGFNFFGFQQWLSIALGILIIGYIALPVNRGISNTFSRPFLSLRKKLSSLFSRKKYSSLFMIGILNGLLPCGMVYLAIAGAVSTGSLTNSMVFMVFFGMGTLPLMWSLTFFGTYLNIHFIRGIKKAYPYLMFAFATVLILRGLGLGIPFVSPSLEPNHATHAVGCHD